MRLVSLALAVDGHPTVDQVDAMLVELQSAPRDENVMKLVDDLLDYRSALRTRAA